MDDAIEVLLKLLLNIYGVMNLEVNWSPGKTEAILQYRGPGAPACMRARRPSPSEPPRIRVPGSEAVLNIVAAYKHLGGEIAASGSLVPLAHGRRKRALAAYAPPATKVLRMPLRPRRCSAHPTSRLTSSSGCSLHWSCLGCFSTCT